jgi:hypothetical protein
MIHKYLGLQILAALILGLYAPGTFAQDMLDSMRSCVAEADDLRRLSCFDRAMTELTSESPTGAPRTESNVALSRDDRVEAMAPTPAPSTMQRSPEDDFGRNEAMERKLEEASGGKSQEITQVSLTVSDVSRRPRGELLISLDNGQIWVETKASSYFPLEAGDTVTIKRRSLGSFSLIGPTGRFTRVKRVK